MDTPPEAPAAPPLVTAITLGVRDVGASRAFYVEGLGFEEAGHVPGEIAFVRSGHGQVLALWNVASMPSEYGDVGHGAQAPPVSLGHNAASADAVRAHYERALAAGARPVTPPETRSWGGTSACVADPDGFRWDFVHNPAFTVDETGRVRLEADG
ncbi:VOC family protein [Zafaria sp. Z1313]|uniref:VOC family protein n=1 Tax=Zafaria sp. Z1313 TaxID=3423202 RepID=UPI003D301A12